MLRVGLAFGAGLVALLIVTPLLAVALPIWLTALAVRAIAARLEPQAVRWRDIYVYDGVLGWRARPDLDVRVLEQRTEVFRIRTGPDGWSGTSTIDESEVVVLGDSHAFGYGVDADATFSAVLREPRVKALGVPGYNMVQELLLLQSVQDRLAGKLVVWIAYAGNDLYDNLAPAQLGGQREPFVCQVEGTWQIVTRHLRPERWTASMGRGGNQYFPTLAALYSPTYLAERAYGACAFLIERGAELCARAGADLVVLSMPCPFVMDDAGLAVLRAKAPRPEAIDPERPDRELGAICARLGIEFIAMRQHLSRSHFKEIDDHLTEAGHLVLADVIRTAYRRIAARQVVA
jgi:hypothetical protein